MMKQALISIVAVAWLVSCGSDTTSEDAEKAGINAPILVERTEARGLNFRHAIEPTGDFALPEIMAAGIAVFDADADGDLDMFLTNAGRYPTGGAGDRLFLMNDDGTFRDGTDSSGLGGTGFANGAALGDIDGDGDLDLFVTHYGKDRLHRNDGGGRFTDITAEAGVSGDDVWSTSAAFFDKDSDGDLDLFVVRYVKFLPTQCTNKRSIRDFCSPKTFKGVVDSLFENDGTGKFRDVSGASGIGGKGLNGLGVLVRDFDGDGRPDVFVANDGEANQLWLNGGSKFAERAVAMGCAFNSMGMAEASMGVAAGDVNGDGHVDLFMTHLLNETNTLYLGNGKGHFDDDSAASRMGKLSRSQTGFGTALFDFENDGDLDCVIVNGRVESGGPSEESGKTWSGYGDRDQLLENDGTGKFSDISNRTGAFHEASDIGRAIVPADLDGDGDLDLIVVNCRGPLRVFENTVPDAGHWISVRAETEKGALVEGAVVEVIVSGRRLQRTQSTAIGYQTAAALPVHFGLGASERVDSIRITWPGGAAESYPGGEADRQRHCRRGEGS